jgi:hypothetical protein
MLAIIVNTNTLLYMEYKSSKDRLSTNPSERTKGKNMDKDKKAKVIALLNDGTGTNAVVAETGATKHAVLAIRKGIEDGQGLQLSTWKKETALTLSQVVSRGSTRLLEEIENIPAGQLALTLAILTDKVLALQDAPTVIVEHRLRVSHEDINSMLKGDIIDVTPIEQKT